MYTNYVYFCVITPTASLFLILKQVHKILATYMVEYKNQDEAHEDLHAHDTIVHEDDNEEVVDVIEDVSIRKK